MKCNVTYRKAVKSTKAMPKLAKAKVGDVQDTLVIQDNGDNTCTVLGVSAAGNDVDISDVATLTVTSSDVAFITVDAPAGMTFALHAVGPIGHSDVAATVTWNDGTIGPFDATLPVDVVAGPAGGIKIVPGDP